MSLPTFTGTSPNKKEQSIEDFSVNVYATNKFYSSSPETLERDCAEQLDCTTPLDCTSVASSYPLELQDSIAGVNSRVALMKDYNVTDFIPSKTYSLGDIVDHDGVRYYSNEDNNLGHTPPATQWQAGYLTTSASADLVSYDNTASGLAATNLQELIDELSQGGGGVYEFVMNGSVTAGQVVALELDGRAILVTGSNIGNWIGIATQNGVDAQIVRVTINTGVDANQSGLTINSTYYVDTDATITTTDTGFKIGRSLSATEILIDKEL